MRKRKASLYPYRCTSGPAGPLACLGKAKLLSCSQPPCLWSLKHRIQGPGVLLLVL
jgi:hypothetical protein